MIASPPELSLEWIPKEFSRVVVVSPHMDDAVLSCGGLLNQLLKTMDCLTVTVCTGDPSGVDPANPPHGIALPSQRRSEEVAALRALGCELVQLNLLDAIYRVDVRTGMPLYPTMQSIWTMPLESDEAHRKSLHANLSTYVGKNQRPTLFLAPMGIGHHVDHILCTQVVLSLVASTDHVLLFEDFPYVVDQGAHVGIADSAEHALKRLNLVGEQRFEQECQTGLKMEWISWYESQIDSIFGSHENVKTLLMKNARNDNTIERFWKVRNA
ncbi:MAG: PIG-L deacetylase family protein [Silvanigrellaceae bacterium]